MQQKNAGAGSQINMGERGEKPLSLNQNKKEKVDDMKRLLAFILCAVMIAVMFSLSFTANSAEGMEEELMDIGEQDVPLAAFDTEMLDEIIIKFFDKSLFPGKEKQYDDEVAKVLKDGLYVVTDNVYVIKAEDLSTNPNAVLNRYKNSKFIEYVEPNYTRDDTAVPNDPGFKSYTSLYTALNAQKGWDIASGGGAIIAIIDSGIASHPDLPKPVASYSAVSSLAPTNDKLGHGTQVAGTAAALGNNSVGTAGINWNAKIMAVKIDDANGVMSVANVAKGIIWAADNGAKVLNLSLSSASPSITEQNAIDYAYNKGCAIFATTGNNAKNTINYPAGYSNVMAVGATDNGTTRANYSNYGQGMGIVGIGTYYTTTASGGYTTPGGTSFACPQVAALASLIWAVNPNLKNNEVYSFIQQGAKTLGGGYNLETGYGLIDIGKTLQLVKDSGSPPAIDTTPPVLTLLGSQVMEIRQGTVYTEPGYTAIDDVDGDITNRVTVTGSVNVNVPGVYRLEYKVSDAAGNTAAATRVVEVMLVDTTPPVLTLRGSQTMQISQGEKYIEPGYAAIDDVDGDITYKVAVTGTVNISIPGVYALEYRVSDAAGNTSLATRSVVVNAAAVIPEPEPQTPADIPSELKSLLLEAPAGTRNDYNGSVGYEVECLADMTVTHLGRPLNGTMNDTHRVSIWNTKTNLLVALADIKPNSPLDSAGFKVAELDVPIVLQKGEKYRIVSAETSGGDSWYDVRDAQVMILSGDFRFTTSVYSYVGGHNAYPSFTFDPVGIRGHVGATLYYTVNEEIPATPPPPPAPQYNTPPTLTLHGSIETTMFADDIYYEAGYSAIDCHGVDLAGAVRVTSNVNTLTPGLYTIVYEVEDAGGNSARATRTVIVAEREEPPRPVEAPVLTIIGSDPIILHIGSGTPYTEQGALAVDEIDGDISSSVQITGSVNRDRAGAYTLTYRVVNSAGLVATATRTVRIIAATEVKSPRDTYNFSGQGKAGTTTTHTGVVVDKSGWMDIRATSVDNKSSITVKVVNSSTGATVYNNKFTAVGGAQFNAPAGRYNVAVTINEGNGNCKYGVSLVTPEEIYLSFTDPEVPLFDRMVIIDRINNGETPLEICLRYLLAPEDLNEFYNDFIAYGWSEDDLAWFGLSIVLTDDGVPLDEYPPGATEEYTVVAGDSLWRISQKYYGTGVRWGEIYELNKDAIGANPSMLRIGLVLTIMIE